MLECPYSLLNLIPLWHDFLQDLVLHHVDSSRSALADLVYGLLKYDPSERLTASQALDHPFFKNAT